MKRLKLTPTAIASELTDFSSDMLRSLDTLGRIKEIDVGTAASEVIYQEDKLRLHYYPAADPQQIKKPLLIVYALVNRPYILDLQPDRSLIRALTERGIPIYLIDWGYPDRADRYLDLDDYINGYLDNCVTEVLRHSEQQLLNLLGVCQGGAFSLCYSALNPDRIASLTTLVTPVDFHTPDNTLTRLCRNLDVELIMDSCGNVPGQLLTQLYNSLMPIRLGLHKQLGLPSQLKKRRDALNFLRMERWINDSPDLAGEAFREFLCGFFRDNGFIAGNLSIGGQQVELKRINQPLLNLFAARDHLVPPAASKALRGLTSTTDYQEKEFAGGHIGIFVGRQSRRELPDLISEWLKRQQ